MAKKDDFDFDAESGGKFKFDLSFLANLTKQQKGIILIAAVALVLVIAIVVTVVLIGTNSGNDTPVDPGTSDGDTMGGDEDGNTEVPEDIVNFYISSEPTKTLYTVGDLFDCAGLTVYLKSEETGSMYVSYDDDPDAFIITGFDSSAPVEEQVITVECRGFTDTFTVTIVAKETSKASLVSITVDPLPKTEYKVGESFSHTGGYIVAEYSDGTTETIKLRMKHVTGFGAISNTPGEHQVKVEYSDDHGGYAYTYITITITE